MMLITHLGRRACGAVKGRSEALAAPRCGAARPLPGRGVGDEWTNERVCARGAIARARSVRQRRWTIRRGPAGGAPLAGARL
eukprot:scaffold157_cov255-Prasinococcus_capsulatus_cf.AAC.2